MMIYTQEADGDSESAKLELIRRRLLDDTDSPGTSSGYDPAEYGRIFHSLLKNLGSQNSSGNAKRSEFRRTVDEFIRRCEMALKFMQLKDDRSITVMKADGLIKKRERRPFSEVIMNSFCHIEGPDTQGFTHAFNSGSSSDNLVRSVSLTAWLATDLDDERLEPNNNNNKRKCPSYQSNFPSKSTRHSDNLLVPDSDGIITGKTISNLPENNVYEQDALPDEMLVYKTMKRKCQMSQRSHPYENDTPLANMFMYLPRSTRSQTFYSFPEKGVTEKDAPLDFGPSADMGVDSEPGNRGSKYEGSQSHYPPNMMNSCSLSNLTETVRCESIPNFPEKGSAPSIPGATRALSSPGGRNTFLESRDSPVTVRIKSFTVPEFSVEIAETATISLLKRTIMEKATTVVGGGVHVDVLLQGKKIRDENKILSETGISGESRLDVILEPKPSQALLCLPCDIPHPQARYSPAPAVVHQGAYDTSTDPLFCNFGNDIRGDELVESENNMSIGKSTSSSREVSVFPCIDVEALDMDPMPQKSKSSKNAQRRKPKPFSIPEVEKLVREVEKLGTGRWQEIKEQAFGNDSNRTRMDLKDKWTSLVKTAKRLANKRRGPVIPQELLDRVLAVETRNSRLQAMQ